MILQGVINSAPAFRKPLAFDGKSYFSVGIVPPPGPSFARITFTLKPDGTYTVIRSSSNESGLVIDDGVYLGNLKGEQVQAKATITGDPAQNNQLSDYVSIDTEKTVSFYVESINSSESQVLIELRKTSSPSVNASANFDVLLTAEILQ